MSGLLPIIEGLADAKTDAERAAWLLACPIGILGKYDMTIRNRLMLAGFHQGLAYVDAERAVLSATREPDGRYKPHAVAILADVRAAMCAIAGVPYGGGTVIIGVDYGVDDRGSMVAFKDGGWVDLGGEGA